METLTTEGATATTEAPPTSVLATPHPCLALSHIKTFLRIGRAAPARGYRFTLLLSQADVDAMAETGLDRSIGDAMDVLTYPGAFNRTECLNVAAKYSELSPPDVAALYVDVGVKSCEALMSHEAVWKEMLEPPSSSNNARRWGVFFGDLGWPCASVVADRLDQNVGAGANCDEDSCKEAAPRTAPLPRVLFQGNIAIDPWCELYGAPSPATEVPQIMGSARWFLLDDEPLSFWNRLLNTMLREISRLTVRVIMLRPYTALRARFGVEPVDVFSSIRRTEAIVLLPGVWGIEPPRSLPPNFKVIHPILPSPAEQIADKAIASFIDSDSCTYNQGLVLISFGTQASLSPSQVDRIARAVSSSPDYCFLWRLPSRNERPPDFREDQLRNLFIAEWLPQNDLLGHPRMRAFVSHVGYGSLYEAAYHGVPLVGIPQFGDQDDSMQRAVRSGWGIRLDKDRFTTLELADAIQRAISPPFRSRAKAWSRRVQAKSGVDEALEWIEYAHVYGVQHLTPSRAMKSSFVAYYNLDVSFFLAAVAFVLCYCCARLITAKRSSGKRTNGGKKTGGAVKEKKL